MPADFADEDAHLKVPAVEAPDVIASAANPEEWLRPVQDEPLTFTAHNAGPADGVIFRPLYQVHHERNSVHWRVIHR